MMTAATWSYQPPYRPAGHESQCYYRANRGLMSSHELVKGLTLFRFTDDLGAQVGLTRHVGPDEVRMQLTLSAADLRTLHAAISDALQDISDVEAERERAESFQRISEEMREADEIGGPTCYYSHPDIHYVAPGQVQAKVRELEASGCKRYMVLPDPQVVDATMGGAAA